MLVCFSGEADAAAVGGGEWQRAGVAAWWRPVVWTAARTCRIAVLHRHWRFDLLDRPHTTSRRRQRRQQRHRLTGHHHSTPLCCRQRKYAENYNKWHNKFVFFLKTAINILVISNHTSFRVLLDKIASMYFIWKIYCYFNIGNGQLREKALCQLYRHAFVPYTPTFSRNVKNNSS